MTKKILDSLDVKVMRTDGQMLTPDKYIFYGNTHMYVFTKNLVKGNYLVSFYEAFGISK